MTDQRNVEGERKGDASLESPPSTEPEHVHRIGGQGFRHDCPDCLARNESLRKMSENLRYVGSHRPQAWVEERERHQALLTGLVKLRDEWATVPGPSGRLLSDRLTALIEGSGK